MASDGRLRAGGGRRPPQSCTPDTAFDAAGLRRRSGGKLRSGSGRARACPSSGGAVSSSWRTRDRARCWTAAASPRGQLGLTQVADQAQAASTRLDCSSMSDNLVAVGRDHVHVHQELVDACLVVAL